MVKKPRRWRLWCCFEGHEYEKAGNTEIVRLKVKGFKAKRIVTRPEHYTSGHFHVGVLATLDELIKLAGIRRKMRGKGNIEAE